MKIGELFVEIGAKLDKFNKGMSDVEKSMQNIGRKLSAVGKQLTKYVTLPIIALGVVSVKAFADFDKAMTESTAIMGKLSDSVKKDMADLAKTISTQTTFSAKELAAAYYYLASAGMNAEQSMKALGEVARFAQAGAFDLSTATDLLTDAQSALGLSSKDAAKNQQNLIRVSDTLVGANTLANASVQQFSEALTQKAGMALRNLGKDMYEGVAALTIFADAGIKGSQAGEWLYMALRDLQSASRKNKETFKEMGVAVYDAQGEMRNIGDIIADLEKLMEGMSDETKGATLSTLGFQDRSQAAILSLVGFSDAIKKNEARLRSLGGVTKEVSDKQLESFSNRMVILKNRLNNVAIELGEKLAPIIEKIALKIEKAAEWFSNLSDSTKETILKVAGLVAALGPVLSILGKILIVVPKLAKAFKFLAGSPMGLVITGLALITVEAIKAKKEFEKSMKLYQREMEITGKKTGWFKKTWSSLSTAIEKTTTRLDINKIALLGYNEAQRKAQGVMTIVKGTAWALSDGVKFLGEKWQALVDILPKVEKGEEGVNEKIKYTVTLAETAAQNIGSLTSSMEGFAFATVDVQRVLDNLKPVMTNVWEEAIPPARDFSHVLDQVPTKFEDIETKSTSVGKKIKSTWEEVSTAIYDLSRKWADALGEALGVAEWFYAEATEFDDSRYKKAIENVEGIYETTKSKLNQQLADQESYYKDITAQAVSDYEQKKKLIEDSVGNEEEKQAMLAALEDKHQQDLENMRQDQLDAEGKAREATLKLESDYQEDLKGLKADEATAMDKHREDELKKQKSIWNQLKKAFGEVIEDLLKLWATKFIGKLIINTAEGIGKVGETITSGMDTIGKGISGVGTGLGKLITSLAKGIAKAAEIIAASAPAILIAAGVALAIYAGFKLIGSLFSSSSKPGSEKDFLRKITEATAATRDMLRVDYKDEVHTTQNILRGIFEKAEALLPKFDIANKHLDKIREFTEPLSKIKFAASGISETVKSPTLYMAGEKGTEHVNITPLGQANYQPNLSIESTPVSIYLDSEKVGEGLIKHLSKLSKRERFFINPNAVRAT